MSKPDTCGCLEEDLWVCGELQAVDLDDGPEADDLLVGGCSCYCHREFYIPTIAKKIHITSDRWKGNCHKVSLSMIRAGLVPGGRVARGWCRGIRGQHSWIVVGDCYDPDSKIIDPTLWTYRYDISGVWVGTLRDGNHHPHGEGFLVLEKGAFGESTDEIVTLDSSGLSEEAVSFLSDLGPMDRRGWATLFGGPVCGWPSAEIVKVAYYDNRLRVFIPIDIVGMLTDINPNHLYW